MGRVKRGKTPASVTVQGTAPVNADDASDGTRDASKLGLSSQVKERSSRLGPTKVASPSASGASDHSVAAETKAERKKQVRPTKLASSSTSKRGKVTRSRLKDALTAEDEKPGRPSVRKKRKVSADEPDNELYYHKGNKATRKTVAECNETDLTARSGSVKEEKTAESIPVSKRPQKRRRKPAANKTNAAADIGDSHRGSPQDQVTVKEEASANKTLPASNQGGNTSSKLIGAHCSIAGGLENAVTESVSMGGRAFGMFLKSQRTWNAKPLDPEAAAKFKAACKEHGFPPNAILPHGSYLLNCGSPNPETFKKSQEALLDELQRCEALGLTLFNFHPGSTCGEITVDECLDKIADCINWVHAKTKFVTTVVENMSCQGNTVGGRFEELRGIIDRVKDKSRIGVCLDTCHAFAAGFDLATEKGYKQFVEDFAKIVGFQYLKAMHLNDSKGPVGCHLDRHENIGKGHIGLDGFRRFMTDPQFDGIPMILETPGGAYDVEIKTLYKMTK